MWTPQEGHVMKEGSGDNLVVVSINSIIRFCSALLFKINLENFERVALGFGVLEVNSNNIDDGEEDRDFDKDFLKL